MPADDELPQFTEDDFKMTVEEARAELQQAELEDRLLIKWHRGWIYAWYSDGPPFDEYDFDERNLLTRISRPKPKPPSTTRGSAV